MCVSNKVLFCYLLVIDYQLNEVLKILILFLSHAAVHCCAHISPAGSALTCSGDLGVQVLVGPISLVTYSVQKLKYFVSVTSNTAIHHIFITAQT